MLSSACERRAQQSVATDSVQAPSAFELTVVQDTAPLDTAPGESGWETGRGGEYIAHAFESQISEAPRMGWVIPPRLFLTNEKHAKITVYSANSRVITAPFHGVLSSVQHDSITRQYHVACEQRGPLAAYELPADVPVPDRAFYTSRPLPGDTEAGMTADSLALGEATKLDSLLSVPVGMLHRELALRSHPELPYYVVRALYDSATRSLLKSGLFLLDRSGKVLAASLRDSTDYLQCDACTVPTYDEGIAVLYRPLNVFVLPGLPRPVLLLDTGTYEGRALSLVTFTPTGELSDYRVYEYVVNC